MCLKVRVELRKKIDESYDIIIEHGRSKTLAKEIIKGGFGRKYCIITDSNVEKIIGKKLLAQFAKEKTSAKMISFPAGEKSKNLGTVSGILEKMLLLGFDRKDCVVALGGGVTGDIAGFAASIYMRGINFVQVPTTLLAMADSSIGGKTGVDSKLAKNSIGAFKQPKRVFICSEFLQTLPKKELVNGMSEVVKHAIILDKGLFSFIENNRKKILSLDKKTMAFLAKKNCEIKGGVVEKDEKEENLRKILNYGHTIGHALESLGNYSKLKHGEAVSIGMIAEAEISKALGLMNEVEVERIKKLLKAFGLPTKLPNYDFKTIIQKTSSDKKAVSGQVFYSLPKRIGKMHSINGRFAIPVEDSIVIKALAVCKK